MEVGGQGGWAGWVGGTLGGHGGVSFVWVVVVVERIVGTGWNAQGQGPDAVVRWYHGNWVQWTPPCDCWIEDLQSTSIPPSVWCVVCGAHCCLLLLVALVGSSAGRGWLAGSSTVDSSSLRSWRGGAGCKASTIKGIVLCVLYDGRPLQQTGKSIHMRCVGLEIIYPSSDKRT